MSPKDEAKDGRLSGDIELINLDEAEDDELTRKKLRDWARQYSKGEFHPSTTTVESFITKSTSITSIVIKSCSKDGAREPKSQTSISKSHEGQKYQFLDWSQHIGQAPETQKPTRRPRHSQRTSSKPNNNFFQDPRSSSHQQRRESDIPPVPPIPEKYRAEWEWQEKKRRAELSDADYPVFNPGAQKAAASSGKYVRKPQPAYPASISGEAGRREAAQRANERRRKAFDAVVLEDVQDRGKGKGKENERGNGGGGRYGCKPLPRSDVRLPRSPGMLNLAQQKPEGPDISPDKTRPLPRLPKPMIEAHFGDDGNGCDEVVEQGLLNCPLREMNKIYADAIDFASEAAVVEYEVEERQKGEKFS